MGSEKYILLDFAKYLSFPEVQNNSKVVNQISARREFVLNLLQKCSIGTSFW